MYAAEAIHVCEFCFGPLEVAYDHDALRRTVTRERIAAGPPNMWRYADLLPVSAESPVDLGTGFTPLILADRLGAGTWEVVASDISMRVLAHARVGNAVRPLPAHRSSAPS